MGLIFDVSQVGPVLGLECRFAEADMGRDGYPNQDKGENVRIIGESIRGVRIFFRCDQIGPSGGHNPKICARAQVRIAATPHFWRAPAVTSPIHITKAHDPNAGEAYIATQ